MVVKWMSLFRSLELVILWCGFGSGVIVPVDLNVEEWENVDAWGDVWIRISVWDCACGEAFVKGEGKVC